MKNNITKSIEEIKKISSQLKNNIKYFDIFEAYQNQISIFEKSKKEIIFVYGILWVLENQVKILELIQKNIFSQNSEVEKYVFPKIFLAKNFMVDQKTIFWKKEIFDIKNIISSQQNFVWQVLEKIRISLVSQLENYQKKYKWLKETLPKTLFANIYGMQKWNDFSKNYEKVEDIFQEIKKQIIIRWLNEEKIKKLLEKIEYLMKKISVQKINEFDLEMYLNQLFIEFKNLQTLFSSLDK